MIENKFVIMWDEQPTMYNFETKTLYKTDSINEIKFYNSIQGAKRIVNEQSIEKNLWIAEIQFRIQKRH